METKPIILPISIVIPTYFEEDLLPRLLESIKKQTAQPLEVIVSDAFSTDKTRDIARSYGAKVVDGGVVAVGRNNGGNAAVGEYIIFLDADTELPNTWTLLDMYVQFVKSGADIASTFHQSELQKSGSMGGIFSLNHIMNFARVIQRAVGKVIFTDTGALIIVKKSVFQHVGGFDQNFNVGEDRIFYIEAIKKKYKYTVLNVTITVSSRRFKNIGQWSMLTFGLFGAFVLGYFGVKATSPLRKKLWSLYGELGGKKK